MVKRKDSSLLAAKDSFAIEDWLAQIHHLYSSEQAQCIQRACIIAMATLADQSDESAHKLISSLEIADTLTELNLDYEAIIAAILYDLLIQEKITVDTINREFDPVIGRLLQGVLRMNTLRELQNKTGNNRNQEQIDNLRKMLVAMVDDVRVVLIKLAERLRTLRIANQFEETKRQQIAKEVSDIYAPLANRLGVWQLKWELEDLAFRYLQPDVYKEIAKTIKTRRIERDKFIEEAMSKLEEVVAKTGIAKYEITGRAKHIYSIYKKMQRKDVDYQEIYDASAIRVLVPEVTDCYIVLSLVHDLWEQIPKEFDDYIQNPKPNGYRSIHTAVIGPGQNNLEVQIRTYQMHSESELGIAAHWAYKEGKAQKPQQLDKIAWLRQVLDWQKELIKPEKSLQEIGTCDNQVYVFSPAGDVIDLPKGATPLDFAYSIHSQIGHRCKGAKVNGNIVPLTYQLKTGEQVEILTSKQPGPSRDWLNPHAGYLATARAKTKVQQWFKQQDYDRHITDGHELLTKELQRLAVHELNLDELANKLQFDTTKDMYAALGSGSLRLSQLSGAIAQLKELPQTAESRNETFITKITPPKREHIARSAVTIGGIDDLLTHLAGCCKPVPGDAIVGHITQAHGITIHRKDCANLMLNQQEEQRIIEVNWNILADYRYPVNLQIFAQDQQGLLRDITTVLSADKANIIQLNFAKSKTELATKMNLTIEVKDTDQLEHVIHRLKQLPNIIEVKRVQ